jgi:hypothetical protein
LSNGNCLAKLVIGGVRDNIFGIFNLGTPIEVVVGIDDFAGGSIDNFLEIANFVVNVVGILQFGIDDFFAAI